jgi:outer membrane cobalamin receptor
MGPEGVVQLPAYLDVEARVSYVYNRKMTFYLNADNLLNAEIQYIPGYREPGINFGLGVCYKF